MKRALLLAACLAVTPGLAPAQSGIEIGNGDFQVINPPILDPIFTLPDFNLIVPRAEPINVPALVNAAPQPLALPLSPGVMLLGEQAIVTIEQEGVRLPDEQFTLP